ncbi:hypothetical protein IWQ60_009857 [Tieghemiomyces parasiticus]|uniref:MIT domain-containing protein n=1 Tax=Tieghemiomyces parasiticus TaxID=78921 RepID=A0A9W8DKH2_9FUNG|nr:hypothetical protein IWQ60_009857 [Tieghemiomyces parasiticus]
MSAADANAVVTLTPPALGPPDGTGPPDGDGPPLGDGAASHRLNTRSFRFLLHLALRKAQTAVILDERRHYVEARRTYRDAIDTITLIINRVGDAAQNRTRLVQLRQTYQDRITEINGLLTATEAPPAPHPHDLSAELAPVERPLARARSHETLSPSLPPPPPTAANLPALPIIHRNPPAPADPPTRPVVPPTRPDVAKFSLPPRRPSAGDASSPPIPPRPDMATSPPEPRLAKLRSQQSHGDLLVRDHRLIAAAVPDAPVPNSASIRRSLESSVLLSLSPNHPNARLIPGPAALEGSAPLCRLPAPIDPPRTPQPTGTRDYYDSLLSDLDTSINTAAQPAGWPARKRGPLALPGRIRSLSQVATLPSATAPRIGRKLSASVLINPRSSALAEIPRQTFTSAIAPSPAATRPRPPSSTASSPRPSPMRSIVESGPISPHSPTSARSLPASPPRARTRPSVQHLFADQATGAASHPSLPDANGGHPSPDASFPQLSTSPLLLDQGVPGSPEPTGPGNRASAFSKFTQLPKLALRGRNSSSTTPDTRPLRRLGSFLLPASGPPAGGRPALTVATSPPGPIPADGPALAQVLQGGPITSPTSVYSFATDLVAPPAPLSAPSGPSTLHDIITEEPDYDAPRGGLPTQWLAGRNALLIGRRRSGSGPNRPGPLGLDGLPPLAAALPPQFAPWTSDLQPYWLLRCIFQSIQGGAWITQRLYMPQRVWFQAGTRLAAVDSKIQACELLVSALHRMVHYTGAQPEVHGHPLQNLDWVLSELTVFEEVIANVQDSLSRKVNGIPAAAVSSANKRKSGPRYHPYQSAPPPPPPMFPSPATTAAGSRSTASLGPGTLSPITEPSHEAHPLSPLSTVTSPVLSPAGRQPAFAAGPGGVFVPTLPSLAPTLSPAAEAALAALYPAGPGAPGGPPSSSGSAFKALGKRMTKGLTSLQASYARDPKLADPRHYVQALCRLCLALQTLEHWTRWFSGWWGVVCHQHLQRAPWANGNSSAGDRPATLPGRPPALGDVPEADPPAPPATSGRRPSSPSLYGAGSPDPIDPDYGRPLAAGLSHRRPSLAESTLSLPPGAAAPTLPPFAGNLQHQQVVHRLNRISEFLHAVVCAFILQDAQALLAKFLKRLREWTLE